MTCCWPGKNLARAAALIAGLGNSAAAQSADSGQIQIVAFQPETRTISPGDVAVAELAVHNAGTESRLLWIGYSVAGPDGAWFDIEPDSITIRPGDSAVRKMEWKIPYNPLPTAGTYRTVIAIWSARPGSPGARRLATADRRETFRIQWQRGRLVDDPEDIWRATQHPLGRGMMKADNVLVSGKGFEFRLAANSCNGAELRSTSRYASGDLAAEMKTPAAPGSLSALFLFAGESGGNDEIDIEIYNDGSRKATFTSWMDGEKRRKADVTLPFDPATDYHEYAILRSKETLVIRVDGKSLARWTGGYSRDPMHALVSAWYPSWLECRQRSSDAVLSLKWITLPIETVK